MFTHLRLHREWFDGVLNLLGNDTVAEVRNKKHVGIEGI
jgi:hypothetical protein